MCLFVLMLMRALLGKRDRCCSFFSFASLFSALYLAARMRPCVSPVRAVPFKTFLERTVTFLLAELLLVSRYIQKLDQVEQK